VPCKLHSPRNVQQVEVLYEIVLEVGLIIIGCENLTTNYLTPLLISCACKMHAVEFVFYPWQSWLLSRKGKLWMSNWRYLYTYLSGISFVGAPRRVCM